VGGGGWVVGYDLPSLIFETAVSGDRKMPARRITSSETSLMARPVHKLFVKFLDGTSDQSL